MDVSEIAGYALSVLIGVSLGMIGGGGSILTVPVLVYFMGVNPVLSTAYSLFVVGVTSLAGALRYIRKDMVNYRAAVVFSIPSFIAVFTARMWIVPAIPYSLFYVGTTEVTRDLAVMLFFALIMLAAAISMIRSSRNARPEQEAVSFDYPMIAVEGAIVGLVTGLVGAGGGFLIIPALVLLAGLPMKQAVGTSLLIIAAKSLIGFLGDIGNQPIDWSFLSIFTGLATVGIFIGSFLSDRVNGLQLRKGFGWFVLTMAIYILSRELWF